MKRLAITLLLCLLPVPGNAQSDVTIRVIEEPVGGDRRLVHEVEVQAEADAVWQAISTAEGWKQWAVPVAWVDLRLGGDIESSYDPAARSGDPANIRNHILAFVPGKMLAFRTVQAPPGFPHREALADIWNVLEIESVTPGRVRIRLTALGYARTPGHDVLFNFFRDGNAVSLKQLGDMLEGKPVDWAYRPGRPEEGGNK